MEAICYFQVQQVADKQVLGVKQVSQKEEEVYSFLVRLDY